MKYIDTEKLVSELTKMQFTLIAAYRKPQSDNIVRAISLEYDDILSLIESLQQEQPSLPSNLDEAALKELQAYLPQGNGPDGRGYFIAPQMLAMYKAGAEQMARKLNEKEK